MDTSDISRHLWESLRYSPAELTLVALLVLSFGVDLFLPEARKVIFLQVVAVVAVLIALFTLLLLPLPSSNLIFFGHFSVSSGLQYTKVLLLLSYLLSILLFKWVDQPYFSGTYSFLMTSMVLGTMLMASSNSLLAVYLSMSLSGIASYLLCAAGRYPQSRIVALSYLLFGMLGMGAMMYGFSLLYGLSSSIYFGSELQESLRNGDAQLLPIFLLVLLGVAFKLGAVPMHFWVPKVYGCMPLIALAYLSTGTKIATWVLVYRLSDSFFVHKAYAPLLALLGVVGFIWGNLSALSQQHPRRLLAYSSVAYAGLFLLLISSEEKSPWVLLFGSTFYVVAKYVAFSSLAELERRGLLSFSDSGLLSSSTLRYYGVTFSLACLALSGLPPFAGFTTKFLLFSTLLKSGSMLFWGLCLLALISTVWAFFYYLKPIYLFFLKAPVLSSSQVSPLGSSFRRYLIYVLLLLLAVLFFYPMPIFRFLSTCRL